MRWFTALLLLIGIFAALHHAIGPAGPGRGVDLEGRVVEGEPESPPSEASMVGLIVPEGAEAGPSRAEASIAQGSELEGASVAPPDSGPGARVESEEALEPVGSIQGWLRPESGTFQGDPESLLRGLVLDLVSLDERRFKARAHFELVLSGEDVIAVSFETDPLPALQFELTLSSLDGRRWSPSSAIAVAPAEGIEFLCHDAEETARISFEVVDAASGEALEDWEASRFRLTATDGNGVLLHAGPLDLEGAGLDGELQWIVEADGYAPAFGDGRAFDRDPVTGHLSARVALERGFATRLVVLGVDGERVPAAGALVRVDGGPPLRASVTGDLILRSDGVPELIAASWRGQRASGRFDQTCLRRRSHLHVILLGE